MTEPALALDDVYVHIGSNAVLAGATLIVGAGEAVGLVGETGSGKSMTARLATGLLPRIGARIMAGSVRLRGTDMTNADQRTWRRYRGDTVALVPQCNMSSLDPIMSIGRQLEETVRLAGTKRAVRAAAARLLRLVQLDDSEKLLNAHPHQLSGGMRQRVMIALALARKPGLLIVDEPTTALDVAVRNEILALLNEIRVAEGLALLLISHDISAIRIATDTVVVMYAGRTVETGPTHIVTGTPAHPYTVALTASLPERAAPGRPIGVVDGNAAPTIRAQQGCAFEQKCARRLDGCAYTRPEPVAIAMNHTAACFALSEGALL